MSESCASCGRKWIDHDGIIRTCKRVQDQSEEINEMKQLIRDLLADQAEETNRLEQLLRRVLVTYYDTITTALASEIKEALK